MAPKQPNFSGYATRNDLLCSDGRTIRAGAFKHQAGSKVPLVWQHQHNNASSVLGHAILEDRPDGVYVRAYFNSSKEGNNARIAVEHGDVDSLSIYATKLTQQGRNVMHGNITEVSLVLAGANPGAWIDNVNIQHSDGSLSMIDDEAIIYTGTEGAPTIDMVFTHSDSSEQPDEASDEELADNSDKDEIDQPSEDGVVKDPAEAIAHAESSTNNERNATMADPTNSEKTVKDIYDAMSEEQQTVVHFFVGEAITAAEEGSDTAQHGDIETYKEGFTDAMNVFDQNNQGGSQRATLSHAQVQTIVQDGIKGGSFKEAFLAHAAEYGIDNIDVLFPDAKTVGNTPELIARQAEWVPKVLGATKHAPFAKIKSLSADLTAPEARAKGYIKGNEKTEEVIQMLRRTTSPTTVYKKQKLDRDDIIDITDFDVIAWLKWEIRFMLNEELARAILIGDGRSNVSVDKIKDPEGSVDGVGIRSIANDAELYAHRVDLAANVDSKALIEAITRARVNYRGSGSPTLYTTDTVLTDLLLLKDKIDRRLYDTEAALASALRVKEIVAVEVMEEEADLLGIIVNLTDYTIGSNRGGELTFFEDFDIDFNQNKYLLETRVSGALTKPKSAIVIRREQGTLVPVITAPSFNGETNVITIPTTTGVDYFIDDEPVTSTVTITEGTTVTAAAAEGYYLAPNSTVSWTYTP